MSEPLARKVQERAEAAGLSTSCYLAELIRRDMGGGWPEGYFEQVVGGRIRIDLQRQGTPIGANDLLIAANTREFGRVVGLKFENWEREQDA